LVCLHLGRRSLMLSLLRVCRWRVLGCLLRGAGRVFGVLGGVCMFIG
jgi:hypothetical protein